MHTFLCIHVQEDEREEMKDVLDMKRVHRKYVARRLAKLRAAKEGKGKKSKQRANPDEIVLDPATAGKK